MSVGQGPSCHATSVMRLDVRSILRLRLSIFEIQKKETSPKEIRKPKFSVHMEEGSAAARHFSEGRAERNERRKDLTWSTSRVRGLA